MAIKAHPSPGPSPLRGGVSGGHRFGDSTHRFGASTHFFGASTHRFGVSTHRFGVSISHVGISSNQGSVCTNQGSVCINAVSVCTNTALVYRLQPFFPHSIYGQRQFFNGSPSSSERLGPKGTWLVRFPMKYGLLGKKVFGLFASMGLLYYLCARSPGQ